ncbi:MAG: DUF357 domain-containing protein [Candidatus Aenigmatarchaeota archaeon]
MEDKIEPQEITRWLEKLEPLLEKIEVVDSRGEAQLQNLKAYVSDSRHFLENSNLVKSFEAMVWAWAIFELCKELEIFQIYG